MGDLAERVGLRKASLFHHFESKDVLYATVLSQLLAGVEVAFLDAAAAEGSFIDRLDALTDAITARTLAWDTPLTLTADVKSLPSGQLQDQPNGTTVTVQDAATKMRFHD